MAKYIDILSNDLLQCFLDIERDFELSDLYDLYSKKSIKYLIFKVSVVKLIWIIIISSIDDVIRKKTDRNYHQSTKLNHVSLIQHP